MKLVIGTHYDGLFTTQEIGELNDSVFRNGNSIRVVASPRQENLGCVWNLNDDEFKKLTVTQARMIVEAVREIKTLPCLNDYIKENEHIFNMDAFFTPSPALKRNVISNFRKAISRFGYMSTDKAVGSIIDEEMKNKGWIVSMMRNHPNYNGNLQIVRKIKVKRPFDKRALHIFIDWAKDKTSEIYPEAHKQSPFGITNAETVGHLKDFLRNAKVLSGIELKLPDGTQINSEEQREFVRSELRKYKYEGWAPLSKEDFREFENIREAFNALYYYESDKLDASMARVLQRIFPETEQEIFGSITVTKEQAKAYKRMGLVEGKKLSKVIGAICRLAGIDKYQHEYTDHFVVDGEGRAKIVKDGYDQKYAALCDAISPKETEYLYVVSVHPTDYVYSSIGHKWSSCHTIDKLNVLNFVDNNGNATYHGMHSGGCMSYLLDGSTVITYVLPANAPLDALETQPKLKRQLWHIGHDKLIQSRLYPDGRDNDDAVADALNKQLRSIFEEIISECCAVENTWILSRDYKENIMETAKGAVHYEDYFHYDNAGIIVKYKGIKNSSMIEIGHAPICPYCGKPHQNTNSIMCSGMENRLECTDGHGEYVYVNGHLINLRYSDGEGYVRCVETGKWYEDKSAAEADGVFYSKDDLMWHQRIEGGELDSNMEVTA